MKRDTVCVTVAEEGAGIEIGAWMRRGEFSTAEMEKRWNRFALLFSSSDATFVLSIL